MSKTIAQMVKLLSVSEVKKYLIRLKIPLNMMLLMKVLIPIYCIEQGILGIMIKNVQFSF